MFLRASTASDEILMYLLAITFLLLIAGIIEGVQLLYKKFFIKKSMDDFVNGMEESE